MTVTVRGPDPVAFAPYGAFVDPPAAVGERALFSQWLEPVVGRSQQAHVNRVPCSALPLTIDRVECHPHAAQLFVPMGEVTRYLVIVMPSDAAGDPDPGRAEAFLVPGSRGVVYAPGVWHTGISVLDADASFAVFMWRGGDDDDVFVSVPAFEVVADDVAAEDVSMVEAPHG